MLSISSKSLYGLKALLFLAEYGEKGLWRIKDIATQRQIPRKFLEQILNQLAKANMVRSFRGKNGGYRLAADASSITVRDIILLLEGGIELVPAAGEATDAIQALLLQVQEKLLESLDISLADLLVRQREQQKVIMFDI